MIILNNCYLLSATAMFRYLRSNEEDGRMHVVNLGRACTVTQLSEVPENYRNKYWLFFSILPN